MDLEINRDIENCFPDLAGATNTINGIWWQNEDYYSSAKKPFVRAIWEDIWTDWKENGNNYTPQGGTNPFNKEGTNPTQQSQAQVGPYAEGWKKAIDAIKRGRINPFDIGTERVE